MSTTSAESPQPPGFHLWHMSMRISEAHRVAAAARQRVDAARAAGGLTASQDERLCQLVEQLDAAAAAASELMRRLENGLRADVPGSVDDPIDGVSVIRNTGPHPTATDHLRRVWGADRSLERIRDIADAVRTTIDASA